LACGTSRERTLIVGWTDSSTSGISSVDIEVTKRNSFSLVEIAKSTLRLSSLSCATQSRQLSAISGLISLS